MSEYAYLDGHKVVECHDTLEWARNFSGKYRHVGDTTIGATRISTVFLGLNHSFGYGPPLWFETVLFGGRLDGEMERYTTWEEAEEGHKKYVEMATRMEEGPSTTA